MLKLGVIGVGNAGNQVVATAYTRNANLDLFAVNCSDTDLKTLPTDIPKALIGDGRGAGKNRESSKQFLATAIAEFIKEEDVKNFISNLDVLFIVSSTGGGTGSGISPILTKVIQSVYPTVYVIPVGILSALKEGLSTHSNSLEYLKELYENLDKPTYMLYDNGAFSDLPSNVMMEKINNRIVDDLIVLSGYYNYITKYSSIDDRDFLNIIKTPGRLVIGSTGDFREKDIDETSVENLLLDDIRTGGHVELQKDKIVNRIGVIANMNEVVASKFDGMVPDIQKVIGNPIESFEHIAINEDRKLPNRVFIVISGLTKVSDRITEINDRVNDILEKQKCQEDADALNEIDINKLNEKRVYVKNEPVSGKVDLQDIFSSFGVNIPTK